MTNANLSGFNAIISVTDDKHCNSFLLIYSKVTITASGCAIESASLYAKLKTLIYWSDA